MTLNHWSGEVVDASLKVHTALGPGLLENAYEVCLAHELRKRGLRVDQQVTLPVIYDGIRIDLGYRPDLIVNDAIVLELKTVQKLLPIHQAQILSYLKLGRYRMGFLLNFHVVHMRQGIRRYVNSF